MKDDLKDILSNLNPDIDQEELMKYLEGKMSPLEQHALEKEIIDTDFETDAVEGLQDFHDKKKIMSIVEQLNSELRLKTEKKKKRRKKMDLKLDPWIIVAIILILSLAVVAFFIIYKKMNG